MLTGRAPASIDEVALGTKALRALSKHVGDTVEVAGQEKGTSRTMKIVGQAVITPIIVNGQLTLGDGALMQLDAFQRFFPRPESDGEGVVNVFLVRLAPGVDRTAAKASLQKDFPGTVLTPYAPAEVENLRRIDTLPFVLAGLLGLLAAATIAHALVTSVRRRRYDLAILKTLGFVRTQVRATVAWQASTLSVIAAAIGLGIGIIGGRWLWIFYADRLGVPAEPTIPLVLLIVIVPAALLLANLIAAVPARAAARTQPAIVLRTE
jgi:ABC-type lipoprotein release transport system permease subunit